MNATAGAASTPKGEDDTKDTHRDSAYRKRPKLHGCTLGILSAAGVFAAWWIATEWITDDGQNVWWARWQWIGIILSVLAAVGGVWGAAKQRKRWSERHEPGEDVPLVGLVIGGVLAAFALSGGLVYWQAEMLTPPGDAVGSVDSSEMLNIARSTTFGLGAIGAIAVLIVNYRRQKSTEIALKDERKRHTELLGQAQADLEHEREKHTKQVEDAAENLKLERAKQTASEIAALHDRYTKAVGQLADDKPAIRLGGVYAIAGLAFDWQLKKDYLQLQACTELLCAYLRSEAPRSMSDRKAQAFSSGEVQADKALRVDRDVRKAALESLSSLKSPRKGGTLASAIAQLVSSSGWFESPPSLIVDLRGINLRGLDLRNARLAGLPLQEGDFTDANLAGASLRGTNLAGANFTDAVLVGTDFVGSTLTDVKPNVDGLRAQGAVGLPDPAMHTIDRDEVGDEDPVL
ncbi:pentapeptide repeat-containing protein [Rhodococcus oxybenzonivorans]|uniref:pentapeptide repeat-containing protein n=1 Tax=Rhodococcus oxybenzonivorans TaxID=1990687 RepID=UPI0029539C00|nr:pentapeptide repeat-containing protein [Rhodococcus oxybenzonivorans]MDV7357687.1 pentapeptide repeat-containing protein [Rhodococcus oxybenzonivorans]